MSNRTLPRTIRALTLAALSMAALSMAAPRGRAASLIGETFDGDAAPAIAPTSVAAHVAIAAAGTIDAYRGEPGRAIVAKIDANAAGGVTIGPIAVEATDAPLAERTLAFDLAIDARCPVRATIESLDTAGNATGALERVVYPPSPTGFFRHSIDLGDMTPVAGGTFDGRATSVRVRVAIDSTDALATLRVDNLSYATPALFVDAKGSDAADGRTPRSAFATIQRALDVAKPGDVIAVMSGTYTNPGTAAIGRFVSAGTPARWITLRALPGQSPHLMNLPGWEVLKIASGVAYVEVRGLTMTGNRRNVRLEDAVADGAIKVKDGKPYAGDPAINGNGVTIEGARAATPDQRPHHIRIVDNVIAENGGGGVNAMDADYITIQGNHVYDNAQTAHYACSGISVFHSWDFDAFAGHKNFVLGNVSHGNRCYVKWLQIDKISDGNGIIIDDNIGSQEGERGKNYGGRTLVANNVVFNNGGSGIHAYASRFVDVVNNTAYHNAQSPELVWSSIFAGGRCADVRITNNVIYARRGRPLDLSVAKSSSAVVYAHNVIFGDGDNEGGARGGLGTEAGQAAADLATNVRADPRLVHASTAFDGADFRLAPGSPAIGAGAWSDVVPLVDIDGKLRPRGQNPDIGAYEFAPPAK